MAGDHGGDAPRPVLVLHERTGDWARRLRPRPWAVSARWVESRSTADLLGATSARAWPVVLIEAAADPAPALRDLGSLVEAASAPLVLFLDPRGRPGVVRAAGELGATLAAGGRPAPPDVADLLARWLLLSARAIAREGWTTPTPADPAREPDEWVDEVVAEAAGGARSWSPRGASATMDGRSDRDRKSPS
ncbi:hypothetical protein [Paludisphaera sp.]|uniref:hypothetical protein n=1 Tax=Paludisphaera sp. TaxID=2017432 RepID=UPI00301C1937